MKKYACGAALGGLAVALFAAPAAAVPLAGDLTAPSLSYYQTVQIPGENGQELYHALAGGCLGSDGTEGVVTFVLTLPDGTQHVGIGESGNVLGSASFGFELPVAAGTASLNATCDLYGESFPYPAVSVEVPAPPTSLPALSAALTADGLSVVVSGSGCAAPSGQPGLAVYSAVTPGPNGDNESVNVGPAEIQSVNPGVWSVTLPAEIGSYEFYAGCVNWQSWAAEYDPLSFEISTTGIDVSTTATGTSTSSTGASASQRLADTGSDNGALTLTSLALIAAGASLTYTGRRRTS